MKHHGIDPSESLIKLRPRDGEVIIRLEDIINVIEQNSESVSLIMLGGVNYYTGHLQKDILDNYPGRTSKKIFNMFRKHLDFPNLVFTQKKFDTHGYDYMVKLHYGRLN